MNSVICLWHWSGRKWFLHHYYKIDEKGNPTEKTGVHHLDWTEINTAITRWSVDLGVTLLSIRIPEFTKILLHENLEDSIRKGNWIELMSDGKKMKDTTIEMAIKLNQK